MAWYLGKCNEKPFIGYIPPSNFRTLPAKDQVAELIGAEVMLDSMTGVSANLDHPPFTPEGRAVRALGSGRKLKDIREELLSRNIDFKNTGSVAIETMTKYMGTHFSQEQFGAVAGAQLVSTEVELSVTAPDHITDEMVAEQRDLVNAA